MKERNEWSCHFSVEVSLDSPVKSAPTYHNLIAADSAPFTRLSAVGGSEFYRVTGCLHLILTEEQLVDEDSILDEIADLLAIKTEAVMGIKIEDFNFLELVMSPSVNGRVLG